MTAWSARHTSAFVDPIVESTIAAMRSSWGVTKIGAVGYWYVFCEQRKSEVSVAVLTKRQLRRKIRDQIFGRWKGG